MGVITSNNESWNGHSFQEVETFIKNRILYNGHDYVEIGGLKWATMNIGASSVTDTGLYFQWGDKEGYEYCQVGTTTNKKKFTNDDYKFYAGSANSYIKYNSTNTTYKLDPIDDAAIFNWGGIWRMPTTAEFQALGDAVNTVWTSDYNNTGVEGWVFTDKTDSSKVLFFPASSYVSSGSRPYSYYHYGYYWSSNCVNGGYANSASVLRFDNYSIYWDGTQTKYTGCTIRPVTD